MPAGIADAAMSSLASFLIGLLAARELDASTLGAFALCYSAFFLASSVPVSLLFTPIEVRMIDLDGRHRTRVLSRSLRIGPMAATAAGVVICLGTLLIPSNAPWAAREALALTSALLTAVSPTQDHLRRVLHAAGRSWTAASLSGIVVVSTAVFVAIGLALPIPVYWVPFLALALGNLVSLAVATMFLDVPGDREPHGLDLTVRSLFQAGRWLLVGSGWGFLSGFLSIAVLTTLANARDVGYAEAARVLSQPITVLAVGLLSVLNPIIMRAATAGDVAHMRREIRLMFILVTAATVLWLAATAVHWPGNPLIDLFPNAYHDPGLLPLITVEQAMGYAALVYTAPLLAIGRQRYQAAIDVTSGAVGLAVVAVTAFTGSYAIAIGGLAGAIVLHVGGPLGLSAVRRRATTAPRSTENASIA